MHNTKTHYHSHIFNVLIIAFIAAMGIPFNLSAQLPEEKVKELRQIWYSQDDSITDFEQLNAGKKLGSHYERANLDSLIALAIQIEKKAIQKQNDQWMVRSLKQKGDYYRRIGKIDSSLISYHSALHYLENDSLVMKPVMYGLIGSTYSNIEQIDSAAYYLKECIKLGEKYDRNTYIRYGALFLGTLYGKKSQYVESIDYLLKALEASETASQRFACHYNIGAAFHILGLEEESKSSFEKAYENAVEAGAPNDILQSHVVLLQLPFGLDTVEQRLHEAIALADSFQLKHTKSILLNAATQFYIDSMQLEIANRYAEQAIALADSIKLMDFVAKAKLKQAKIKELENDPVTSLNLCRQVFPYFESFQDSSYRETLFTLMANNFKALGQSDSALFYLERRVAISDALDNQNITKQAVSKYLEHKKEQEIQTLAQEKELAEQIAKQSQLKQKQSYLLLTLFGVIFISISIIYYVLFNQKQKRNALLEQMNQSLEVERKKLEKANKQLNRFSSVVSHDVLSNLDLILSTGNVLVGEKGKTDNLPKYYEMTQSTARQLKNYCLNLLQQTKKEQLAIPKNANPMPILNTVLGRYGAALQEAKFQTKTEPLSMVNLPEALIEQIFQNLISNALRHAATAEHPMLWISEAKSESHKLQWIFEDNGPGVSSQQKKVIFDPVETLQNDDKGHHIGLHLLQSSLREAGADIWVEDRSGGGARFIIEFI